MEPNASDVASIRREYLLRSFDEKDRLNDPSMQFRLWFTEAIECRVNEPNAMVLGTASRDGSPHSRVVLLKGFDERGLVFYTNYESDKGQEIAANNKVALLFFWPELERQVRIEGEASLLPASESDTYFHSRPEPSRVGAHASPQSRIIGSREELEKRMKELEQQYAGSAIPRPAHWGGYLVAPSRYEFWQGRAARLHDRFLYELKKGSWKISRLAP